MMLIILCCIEDEEILTIKTEELRSILHEGEFLTFDVYPFDGKE